MTPLATAHGGPPLRAQLRRQPEDFIVDELPAMSPDGDGDHAWLVVRKRGANTAWVATELARYCGVRPVDVGYAGLKDRDALTRQVFTVHLPGRPTPDWSAFGHPDITIESHSRHRRKLKRGALQGNRFELTLRAVSGDRETAGQRLEAIRQHGVPNYFGEQRFGLGGANLQRAAAMFAGKRSDRRTRSLLLSAARSELFNAVLEQRVRRGDWNRGLPGEIWSLAGSRSWFGPEDPGPELDRRLAAGDVHPSGPLWGRGALPTAGEARALELDTLAPHAGFREGLERAGLTQDRRALRLIPEAFEWHWPTPDTLTLAFQLPPGSYATVLVRELADPR